MNNVHLIIRQLLTAIKILADVSENHKQYANIWLPKQKSEGDAECTMLNFYSL